MRLTFEAQNGHDVEVNIFRTDWNTVKVFFDYRFRYFEKDFLITGDDENEKKPIDYLDFIDVQEFIDLETNDVDWEIKEQKGIDDLESERQDI